MAWSDSLAWSPINKYLAKLSLISALVFALDQITKKIALDQLWPVPSKPLVDGFLKLTLVFNEGGAFSTRLGSTIFYTFASGAVMIFVIIFLWREAGKNRLLDFALALVVGGALGNLVDRLRYGSVIDFIDVEFFDIHLPQAKILFYQFPGYDLTRWPVFNVADSAVTVGMILIVLVLVFGSKKPKYADHPGNC